MPPHDRRDLLRERVAPLFVVETNAEARACRSGDDVGRRVADVEIRDLDVAWLKPGIPVVEHERVDLGKCRDQLGDRVVGKMGVGDMALLAGHLYPDVDRSTPADLYHVTQATDRA